MKIIVFSLCMLSAVVGYGQATKVEEDKPFIEVVGTAETKVTPDKIFISISLSDKVLDNKKRYSIQEQETGLKNALRELNIDLKNLRLSDALSENIRIKHRDAGFKVVKDYILEVKTADEVSNVFSKLYELNIKECSIERREYSGIDSLRKAVRIDAIKAAKAKAEYLLNAIGEQLGKPIEVRESNEPTYSNYRGNSESYLSNTGRGVSIIKTNESETNFEQITVKFSYFIKYSIK